MARSLFLVGSGVATTSSSSTIRHIGILLIDRSSTLVVDGSGVRRPSHRRPRQQARWLPSQLIQCGDGLLHGVPWCGGGVLPVDGFDDVLRGVVLGGGGVLLVNGSGGVRAQRGGGSLQWQRPWCPHHPVGSTASQRHPPPSGNYEHFIDVTLTRDSNITTGKIYQREGDHGKTVQVVPHVTDEIKQWMQSVSSVPVWMGRLVQLMCVLLNWETQLVNEQTDCSEEQAGLLPRSKQSIIQALGYSVKKFNGSWLYYQSAIGQVMFD